jgi:hypothetical protein
MPRSLKVYGEIFGNAGVIIYIDVPISNKKEMDSYLSEYKEIMEERFGQIEMYIVSWEIEVI